MENVAHVTRDMAKFGYTADKAGSRTQDPIQAPQSTSREASVERATVVKSSCDEGMDKGGGSRSSEWASDSAELAQLVEAVYESYVKLLEPPYRIHSLIRLYRRFILRSLK